MLSRLSINLVIFVVPVLCLFVGDLESKRVKLWPLDLFICATTKHNLQILPVNLH